MPAELATTLEVDEETRLEQAEAVVRSYCGWHIAPSRPDETVVIRATSSPAILLPSMHVTAVAVAEAGVPVASTAYSWEASGILYRRGGWPADVTVTFTHGYEDVPAEVAAIVQAIAQRAVNDPGSLVRVQDGPFSETYGQTGLNQVVPLALLEAEKGILDRYRIPPRP